ncbi:MAG: hypothetical protein QW767_05080 [Thermoprotei archaeon]
MSEKVSPAVSVAVCLFEVYLLGRFSDICVGDDHVYPVQPRTRLALLFDLKLVDGHTSALCSSLGFGYGWGAR